MGKIVLGIDFGSDSVRCVAVDAVSGKEVSTATVEYPRWKAQLFSDAAEGRYRQHPLDYTESLEKCVRNTLAGAGDAARDVVGLAFDTTASTPVLTDRKGTPLALLDKYRDNPDAMFILWKDHTAIAEADRINEVAHSNCPDYTSFSGGTYSCEWVWAKMLHCLKSSPELKEDVWSWVEHGDWIAGLLTGNTDPGTMARSRCIAGHKAMWSAKWGGLPTEGFLHEVDPELDIFKGHLFRDTVTCDRKVGGLTREWAERLGLPEGIAVGVGAIDCHVGAVGAGITPGNLVKVMGTSTCDIAIATYEEVGDRLLKGICGQVDGSVVPGKIGFEAGQSAFGDIYAWFSRFTGKGIPELTAEAEKLPLTMDDPVSLDWMNGRRTPDADPRVKGLISGLTLGTTPGMVFKSLVEATAFGSRAINERFIQEGVPIEEIIAVGGISRKSPFVMQTMADVLGMPIKVLDSDNACALGAAMFASVAAGIHPDVETAQKHMTPGICALYEPDAARHGIYDRRYALYKALA